MVQFDAVDTVIPALASDKIADETPSAANFRNPLEDHSLRQIHHGVGALCDADGYSYLRLYQQSYWFDIIDRCGAFPTVSQLSKLAAFREPEELSTLIFVKVDEGRFSVALSKTKREFHFLFEELRYLLENPHFVVGHSAPSTYAAALRGHVDRFVPVVSHQDFAQGSCYLHFFHESVRRQVYQRCGEYPSWRTLLDCAGWLSGDQLDRLTVTSGQRDWHVAQDRGVSYGGIQQFARAVLSNPDSLVGGGGGSGIDISSARAYLRDVREIPDSEIAFAKVRFFDGLSMDQQTLSSLDAEVPDVHEHGYCYLQLVQQRYRHCVVAILEGSPTLFNLLNMPWHMFISESELYQQTVHVDFDRGIIHVASEGNFKFLDLLRMYAKFRRSCLISTRHSLLANFMVRNQDRDQSCEFVDDKVLQFAVAGHKGDSVTMRSDAMEVEYRIGKSVDHSQVLRSVSQSIGVADSDVLVVSVQHAAVVDPWDSCQDVVLKSVGSTGVIKCTYDKRAPARQSTIPKLHMNIGTKLGLTVLVLSRGAVCKCAGVLYGSEGVRVVLLLQGTAALEVWDPESSGVTAMYFARSFAAASRLLQDSVLDVKSTFARFIRECGTAAVLQFPAVSESMSAPSLVSTKVSVTDPLACWNPLFEERWEVQQSSTVINSCDGRFPFCQFSTFRSDSNSDLCIGKCVLLPKSDNIGVTFVANVGLAFQIALLEAKLIRWSVHCITVGDPYALDNGGPSDGEYSDALNR